MRIRDEAGREGGRDVSQQGKGDREGETKKDGLAVKGLGQPNQLHMPVQPHLTL